MPDREGVEELLFCTAISRSLSGKQTREAGKENEYKLFDKGEEKCGGTSRRKIVDIRIYEYIAKTWQVHRSLLRKTFSKLFGFD